MSEVELHQGTLIKVNRKGLSVEEWVRRWVVNYLMTNQDDYYSEHIDDQDFNFLSAFYDLSWNTGYVVTNKEVYRVVDHHLNSDFICNIQENTDGTYSYITQFYNGGACLTEVLENELKSIENE